MKKSIATIIVGTALSAAVPLFSSAAVPATATQTVPGTMNYQGYLADPSTGAPYADGIYTLECRLYNAATGGACLWGGQYSAYVKDGYFNIMLGDSAATALTTYPPPTYANGDLWKALWGSSPTDTLRYLGVKPLQDAKHATIAQPIEITPRQQLLSSPFAFRAERAQYADGSKEAFEVGGNLTVSGSATFSGAINATSTGTQKLGPIQTSSSSVNLGNGNTTATVANRAFLPSSVYDVGQTLYFKSYYSMYFQSTAGNMEFSVPSGYKMYATGSGSFVSDVPVNTIGGSSTTTIKGNSVNVSATGSATFAGSTGATVGKSGASTTITGSNVTINPSGNLYLKGMMYYQNASGSNIRPFIYKSVSGTITKGSNSGDTTIGDGNDYRWVIVGYQISPAGLALNEVYARGTNIHYYFASSPSFASSVTFHCLGIHKSLCD